MGAGNVVPEKEKGSNTGNIPPARIGTDFIVVLLRRLRLLVTVIVFVAAVKVG